MAEIFSNFEINRTPRWRRLVRLSGLSLLLHVAVAASLMVLPSVRDTLSMVGLVSGAEYVDEDYDRTIIGERAEMIAVSPDGKLHYPPGYFASPKPEPRVLAEVKPTPTPKPTPKPTPVPTPKTAESPEEKPGGQEMTATKEPQTKEEAEKAIDEAARKNGIVRPADGKINKRPLKDWLARANELKTKGQLDLSGTVELVIMAQRDDKGRLYNPQVVRKSGDPQLIAVAKDLVAALNSSNALYFLEGSGGGDVRFVVKMDQSQVAASVESDVGSAEKAQQMARGYGVMLVFGKAARQGKDEAIIYQNTRISARGKQVVVNFSMPRQAAGEMLKKQLPST